MINLHDIILDYEKTLILEGGREFIINENVTYILIAPVDRARLYISKMYREDNDIKLKITVDSFDLDRHVSLSELQTVVTSGMVSDIVCADYDLRDNN